MVSIAATNTATPSLQMAFNGARLDRTRRQAEDARSELEGAKAENERAEQYLQDKRDKLRSSATYSALIDTTYISQLRAYRSAVAPATQEFLLRMYAAASEKFAATGNALKSNANSRPFINTLGQATGRIVDLTA
jgi:type II secretory pathway pseudopilin PulG